MGLSSGQLISEKGPKICVIFLACHTMWTMQALDSITHIGTVRSYVQRTRVAQASYKHCEQLSSLIRLLQPWQIRAEVETAVRSIIDPITCPPEAMVPVVLTSAVSVYNLLLPHITNMTQARTTCIDIKI